MKLRLAISITRHAGLHHKEANEFIIPCLPHLKDTPNILIHFAGEEYSDQVEIVIDPKPQPMMPAMISNSPL